MSFLGTVKIKSKLEHSNFPYPERLITDKELLLIEQTKEGNCICLWGGCGICTINRKDIELVTWNRLINPLKYIEQFYNSDIIEELMQHYLTKSIGENGS